MRPNHITSSANGKVKTGPLDDLASARWVWRCARHREPVPADVARRMGHDWIDGSLLAQQEGEPGIKHWMSVLRIRLRGEPERFQAISETLAAARDDGVEPDGAPPAGPEPFRLKLYGAREFADADFRLEWLIKRVLVKGQAAGIGAPKKGMKTSIALDALVSLASGTPFLGEFEVPRPVRAMIMIGESGQKVAQETVRRICRAKGISLESLEGRFFIGFDLPQLSSREQMNELARVITEHKIGAVFIDPLYLCLLSSSGPGPRLDAANLFHVGPLLMAVGKTCLDAGATPVLLHHFKQSTPDPYGVPELGDFAFAGIQEYLRQWVLMRRRERYVPGSGEHKLWLSVGGSAGHSGEWCLDIREGVVGDDFDGRYWDVSIRLPSEAQAEAATDAQANALDREAERRRQADERKQKETEADAGKALDALTQLGKATRRHLRETVNVSGDRIGAALRLLLNRGLIRTVDIQVRSGNGYRSEEGFEPVEPLRDVPGWFRDGRNDPATAPFRDRSGTGGDSPPLRGESSSSRNGTRGHGETEVCESKPGSGTDQSPGMNDPRNRGNP